IKNCIENIVVLKDQHAKTKAGHRYLDRPGANLSDLVNPIILKLIKEEDNLGMAHLEPIYILLIIKAASYKFACRL
ncbi:uncharacterized protein B0P05DRAFT_474670, partial [Gilbertella persicaria]|uniref:uncharacterized protein n=1 Tax=Gilbertella persicaria TaxID=101096 RepID=UPI00221E7000